MPAIGFYILAERISSETRAIKLYIHDHELSLNGTVDNETEYRIIRKNIRTAEEKVIYTVTKASKELVIKDNVVTIKYTDNAPLHATEYLYKVHKMEDTTHMIDFTQTVGVRTLPQRINGFKLNLSNCEYNSLGIPTKMAFNWESLDTAIDNFDVKGYNIYYCTSPRGQGRWGAWNRLKGHSTDASKSSVVNLIPTKYDDLKIEVPQISDESNPMDMMFTIVARTSDTRKSMFSDMVSFTLENVVTQLIKRDIKNIVKITTETEQTRPVSLEFEPNAFTKDTTILFRRSLYDPPNKSIGNTGINRSNKLYTYDIKSSNPLDKWVLVKMNIQLYVGQTYEVRIYNNDIGSWMQIPSDYDPENNNLEFILSKLTEFVVIVKGIDPSSKHLLRPSEVFAKYTTKILKNLPTWFKMRRDPLNSVGSQFLNVTGLEYDDMEFILNYATAQTHIDTIDVGQIDMVYKAVLPPSIKTGDRVIVSAESFVLEYSNNLVEFFSSDNSSLKPEVFYANPYLIDFDKRLAYVKKPYNPSDTDKYGKVLVTIYDKNSPTESYYEEEIPLQLHHVWNFFDEFGMLVNTPRLLGERNSEYKERILDVFKNVSNASKDGLFNGIARELGIRINKVWQDTTKDFVITEPMVTLNEIKINGEFVNIEDIFFTSDTDIIIKNRDNKYSNLAEVTYVSGIEMHTFHNRKDIRLYNQLYTIEETATDLFRYYVDLIKQRVPTDWGKFRWNEGYWDITDEKMSGVGFLPVIYDSKIAGFLGIDETGEYHPQMADVSDKIKPIVILPKDKYIPTGKPVNKGISIIPNDYKITGKYWKVTPLPPEDGTPGTGGEGTGGEGTGNGDKPIPGTPQDLDKMKAIAEANLKKYIPDNTTSAKDLEDALKDGITDPNTATGLTGFKLGETDGIKDGRITGTFSIYKDGVGRVEIPIDIPIRKETFGVSIQQNAEGEFVPGTTPGRYRYTQYVTYELPDGTDGGTISESYDYTVADDVIGIPTFETIPLKPAQQDVVKIVYPPGTVHKQYRIGPDGIWLDYPTGGIIVRDNGYVYSRGGNVFGTWSGEGSIYIGNIDITPPSGIIDYGGVDPTKYRREPYRITITPEPGSIIINNDGRNYIDFDKNGEYTFDIRDEAGNIGHRTVKVTNIVPIPHVWIDYSTIEITDGIVKATVVSDYNITITNNNGSFEHDFIVNGQFTFYYKDDYGFEDNITAIVTNIYHEAPKVIITYSELAITEDNVIARLVADKPITITNNLGNDTYTFTQNGEFTFEYQDTYGNYSATAVVNNIYRKVHQTGDNVYTYTDDVWVELDLRPPYSYGNDEIRIYQDGILRWTIPPGYTGKYYIPINPTIGITPIRIEVGEIVPDGTKDKISIPYIVHDGEDFIPGTLIIPEDGNGGFTFSNRFALKGDPVRDLDVWITYDILEPTNKHVIATVHSNRFINITNNNGSGTYDFAENGEFTFYYTDSYGYSSYITATVKNIYVTTAIKYSPTIVDIYNYHNEVKFGAAVHVENPGSGDSVRLSVGNTAIGARNDGVPKYYDSCTINVDTTQPIFDIAVSGEEVYHNSVAGYVSFDFYITNEHESISQFVGNLPRNTVRIYRFHNMTAPKSDPCYAVKSPGQIDVYTFTKDVKFKIWITEDEAVAEANRRNYLSIYGVSIVHEGSVGNGIAGNFTMNIDTTKPIVDLYTAGSNVSYGYYPTLAYNYSVIDNLSHVDGSDIVNYNSTNHFVIHNAYATAVSIEYDDTSPTQNPVKATLKSNHPITITNNGGLNEHIFSTNGSFTFYYIDRDGNSKSITATVNNIDVTAFPLNSSWTVDGNHYNSYDREGASLSLKGNAKVDVYVNGTLYVHDVSTSYGGTTCNLAYGPKALNIVLSEGCDHSSEYTFDYELDLYDIPTIMGSYDRYNGKIKLRYGERWQMTVDLD